MMQGRQSARWRNELFADLIRQVKRAAGPIIRKHSAADLLIILVHGQMDLIPIILNRISPIRKHLLPFRMSM